MSLGEEVPWWLDEAFSILGEGVKVWFDARLAMVLRWLRDAEQVMRCSRAIWGSLRKVLLWRLLDRGPVEVDIWADEDKDDTGVVRSFDGRDTKALPLVRARAGSERERDDMRKQFIRCWRTDEGCSTMWTDGCDAVWTGG